MKESKLLIGSISIFILLCFYNGSFNLPASNENSVPAFDNKINEIPFFVRIVKGSNSFVMINPKLYRKNTSAMIIRKEIVSTHKIMTNGKMLNDELAFFLVSNNKKISLQQAKDFAKLYINESKAEGVNHDIAFCQMCLETGFLKFNGIVRQNQNNFCGLGAINNNTCGEKFNSKRDGVRAHIQHLKAYASYESLKNSILDKRFHFVKRGISPSVGDLTGKWAVDPEYGNKIKRILKRLEMV
ncbi:MAG: glucosaminidase domain-containing protein [Bacteroidales bacterium]|nr:glucosaminidase domain-containing protein [Bacteroidales bacterium]